MKKQIVNKNGISKKTEGSTTGKKKPGKKVIDKGGEKKFKIQELMNNLTHSGYKSMRRELPKLIGKCINTLDNYSNIPIDSKEDIPYHAALTIEKYFCIEAGSLSNLPTQ
ncbi:hypothetical protein [Pedobacter sp. B4-66]|uniref:hypothetical protein n=1 Tax=Pedobacter sp. B4-66 TaxID=2817280 RepID=UPI001BD9BE07|nr:hypothetical protein [Pedobacter sp. B4-66]